MLIAIDSAHRIVLLPQHDSGHRPWTLPRRPVRLQEAYTDAVNHLCQDLLASYPTRLGSVVGRRWAAPPATAAVRVETRF